MPALRVQLTPAAEFLCLAFGVRESPRMDAPQMPALAGPVLARHRRSDVPVVFPELRIGHLLDAHEHYLITSKVRPLTGAFRQFVALTVNRQSPFA